MLNAALMSAGQPSFEKRSCHMDAWQHLMGQFVAAADDDDFVLVASLRQAGITAPPVGVDHAAGCYGLLDEGNEATS